MVSSVSLRLTLLLIYTASGLDTATPGRSPPATKHDGLYHVAGAGSFTQSMNLTFASFPTELQKSNYVVDDKSGNPAAKFNHKFTPAQVTTSEGLLHLEVPGGQTKSPILCAEVVTSERSILYASVRTTAIFSPIAGTVHGNFFYHSDSQEIDIEYLTDPNSLSNPGNGSQPLMLTNQATDGNPKDATEANVASPPDRTTALHEYRTDWLGGKSVFYVDGVKVKTLKTNVPTIPGPWVWNNWCNGDPGFTVGPPNTNNRFKLNNILMYYNTSTSEESGD